MELLIIDTSQIQPYVFGSNRLRENIGASYLVSLATQDWVVDCLPGSHNVRLNNEGRIDLNRPFEDDKKIDDGDVAVEVLYFGGGNAVLLFEDLDRVKTFKQEYTRFVLEHAPGLQVVIAHQEFEWVKGRNDLHPAMIKLFAHLEQRKRKRAVSAPLLGLGVTVMCHSTGLPAEGLSESIPGAEGETRYPASGEILAKLDAFNEANDRLKKLLPPLAGTMYPYQLDHLGRSMGEHSYIAVIHADGDGIGRRLLELGKTAADNRAYIQQRRQFSETLKHASREALKTTLKALDQKEWISKKKIVQQNAYGKEITSVPFQPERRKDGRSGEWVETGDYYLPFRPIVFGGDDLTLICDGRLGLSLAQIYMEAFIGETATLGDIDGNESATASTGVAIVKSHYPFSRAYDLSESLANNAKQYRSYLEEQTPSQQKTAHNEGCLDWHFAAGGLLGSPDEIKRAHYCVNDGSLTLRPLSLSQNAHRPYRTWQVVRKGIDYFQDTGDTADRSKPPVWTERRSKVKALRDALRQGGEETRRFLIKYNIEGNELPDVGAGIAFQDDGWHQEYCAYYDAIEAADWFIDLDNKGEDNA